MSEVFHAGQTDARPLNQLIMSDTKNFPQAVVAYMKKYFVLISIVSLVLGVTAVYAVTQIYSKKDHSPEYVYQDKSGTKVVLQATQCGYSVEIQKSMSEQFGKASAQVKALTLHGDGWKKEGCWIKLDTTNEVAVSTEPGKIDTVLDLAQFTQTGATKTSTPKEDSKGIKSLFSKGVDPTTQDVFAYIPKLPDTELGASYTFIHKLSCADANGYLKLAKKLQKNGYNPNDWRAGVLELGGMVGGQWERAFSKLLCYQPDPANKRLMVLIDSDMNSFPYDELSTEPFKAAKTN